MPKNKKFTEITNKATPVDASLEDELEKHFSIANIEEENQKEINQLTALQEKMDAFHRNTVNYYEQKILSYKNTIKQLEEQIAVEKERNGKLLLYLKGYNRLKQMYKNEKLN